MEKHTTQSFLNRLNTIHNSFYQYPNFEYTKIKNKMNIICPVHGEFTQSCDKHLQGQGCKKCGTLRSNSKRTKSQDTFIKECIVKHRDEYDYSKVVYAKDENEIIIICSKHGEFHLQVCN